jgi:mRNA-degrading endonuclease RelE of RelBE toxin-antitoxin system
VLTAEPDLECLKLTGRVIVTIIVVIMVRSSPYVLLYAPAVKEHLKTIDSKYRSLIRETIEAQLEFEPTAETRNRKPVRQPAAFAAEWELRFGPDNRFRVLYQVNADERQVSILAVGEKKGNGLLIGREEIDL